LELRDVLAALRGAWWLSLAGVLLGGVVALLASLAQTPLYTAATQLFVSTPNSSSTSDAFQGSQFSQERVLSYARLIGGEEIARRVAERLDLDGPPSELSDRIVATAVTDTVLIDVSVTDASPEQARAIAEAVGEEFIEFVSELETPEGEVSSPIKVEITDRPEVPEAPTSPQTPRNFAFGALVGLILGAGLAVLRARLDRTVKDPDETSELVGAPVIGTVLRDELLEKRHTIDRAGDSRTAEDYRQLRTNLQFVNIDQPPKVIMATSALPSEGKTTLVINLALALADANQRVIVVEADLRRPKVTRYLGMVGGVGLTNILAGTADVEDVTQQYRDNVAVIAAGPTPPNPGELLASSHMAALMAKLREHYDYVLVDVPPLLPVADSAGLAATVDGVVLSVRYGSTRKDQLQQAALTLQRVGAQLLGVVLNIVPPKADLASAYGYGYSYSYTVDRVQRKRRDRRA
jgi:capsular exopolysaccharide synthesis family protein